MLSIFISFCLLIDDTKCHTKQFDALGANLPLVCMQEAQTKAIEYLEEHPGYTVKKWTCGKQESKI